MPVAVGDMCPRPAAELPGRSAELRGRADPGDGSLFREDAAAPVGPRAPPATTPNPHEGHAENTKSAPKRRPARQRAGGTKS